MTNVDFHNVVDVSVKHVHKYTGGWGDGDSYTIAFHILDSKNEINWAWQFEIRNNGHPSWLQFDCSDCH